MIIFAFVQHNIRQPREIPIEFTVVLDTPQHVAKSTVKETAVEKPAPPPEIEPVRDPEPPPPLPAVQQSVVKDPPKPKPIIKPPEPKPKPPEPSPEPAKTETKPEPKPKTPEVKIGPRLVRNGPQNVAKTPKQPALSAKEIERLLKQGAVPGDRNVIPEDEIARCMLLVKRALYAAWLPPSRADAGTKPAEVEIRLGAGGSIVAARMILPSGNAVYDRSVMAAAQSVKRVDGLTANFLRRYDRLTVSFVLDDI